MKGCKCQVPTGPSFAGMGCSRHECSVGTSIKTLDAEFFFPFLISRGSNKLNKVNLSYSILIHSIHTFNSVQPVEYELRVQGSN